MPEPLTPSELVYDVVYKTRNRGWSALRGPQGCRDRLFLATEKQFLRSAGWVLGYLRRKALRFPTGTPWPEGRQRQFAGIYASFFRRGTDRPAFIWYRSRWDLPGQGSGYRFGYDGRVLESVDRTAGFYAHDRRELWGAERWPLQVAWGCDGVEVPLEFLRPEQPEDGERLIWTDRTRLTLDQLREERGRVLQQEIGFGSVEVSKEVERGNHYARFGDCCVWKGEEGIPTWPTIQWGRLEPWGDSWKDLWVYVFGVSFDPAGGRVFGAADMWSDWDMFVYRHNGLMELLLDQAGLGGGRR